MNFSIAEAYAPATVANLGVGFDILGLALSEPGDTVRAECCDERGVHIAAVEGDGGKLPRDPRKNTAAVAAQSVLNAIDASLGVRLTIYKGLPAASGLGSSAASAVAAAVAVNALLGSPLTKDDLLPACLDGEAIASGYHPDNVAPCLYGGITLAYGIEAHQIIQIAIPDGIWLALVTPDVEVPTAQARAVLPQQIPLQHMIKQTAAVARLTHALHTGDLRALGEAMESDSVIEPARAYLMPELFAARRAAKASGALGLVISGAGPTLCALCDSDSTARGVTNALADVYRRAGIGAVTRATQIAPDGARVTALR